MLALPELTQLLNRTYWELHLIWMTLSVGLGLISLLIVVVIFGLVGVCQRLDTLNGYEAKKYQAWLDFRATKIPSAIRDTEELFDWYDNQPKRAA